MSDLTLLLQFLLGSGVVQMVLENLYGEKQMRMLGIYCCAEDEAISMGSERPAGRQARGCKAKFKARVDEK